MYSLIAGTGITILNPYSKSPTISTTSAAITGVVTLSPIVAQSGFINITGALTAAAITGTSYTGGAISGTTGTYSGAVTATSLNIGTGTVNAGAVVVPGSGSTGNLILNVGTGSANGILVNYGNSATSGSGLFVYDGGTTNRSEYGATSLTTGTGTFTGGPYTSDWFRNSGGSNGLYNSTYASGIYFPSSQLAATYNSSSFEIGGNYLYCAGSASSYGAITVEGSQNGWSGINFNISGTNQGTLMCSSGIMGFFNTANSAWNLQVDNSGNGTFGGSVAAGNGAIMANVNFNSFSGIASYIPVSSGYVGIGSNATGGAGEMDFVNSANSSSGFELAAFWMYNGTQYVEHAQITSAGTYSAVSMRAFKKNITPLPFDSMDIIRQTDVVHYNIINHPEGSKKYIGIIADDTPSELSGPDRNRFLATEATALLIDVCKKLDARLLLLEGK